MLSTAKPFNSLEKRIHEAVQKFAEPLAKKGFLLDCIKECRRFDADFEIIFKAENGSKVSIIGMNLEKETTLKINFNDSKIANLNQIPVSGAPKAIIAGKINIRKSIKTGERPENNEVKQERAPLFGERRLPIRSEDGYPTLKENEIRVSLRNNRGPLLNF